MGATYVKVLFVEHPYVKNPYGGGAPYVKIPYVGAPHVRIPYVGAPYAKIPYVGAP